MCSPSQFAFLPPSPSNPSRSSQYTSPEHLSHASNLGWGSVSPLIVYLSQCCSLLTSHPRLLPQRHLDKIHGVRSQDPMRKCFYNPNICLSTLMVKTTTHVRFQREKSGRRAMAPRACLRLHSKRSKYQPQESALFPPPQLARGGYTHCIFLCVLS